MRNGSQILGLHDGALNLFAYRSNGVPTQSTRQENIVANACINGHHSSACCGRPVRGDHAILHLAVKRADDQPIKHQRLSGIETMASPKRRRVRPHPCCLPHAQHGGEYCDESVESSSYQHFIDRPSVCQRKRREEHFAVVYAMRAAFASLLEPRNDIESPWAAAGHTRGQAHGRT